MEIHLPSLLCAKIKSMHHLTWLLHVLRQGLIQSRFTLNYVAEDDPEVLIFLPLLPKS